MVNVIAINSALVDNSEPVIFLFNSLIISFIAWFIKAIPYPI
ncbi:12599_t:CDS:1, partial [Dentiscutata erythropus]